MDVLLRKFQQAHSHMAILVDEYGSASGIITLENVVEEVVGPIQDEFDVEPPLIVARSRDVHEVSGSCPLDLLVRQLRLSVPEEITAKTIGGLVTERLGRFAKEGDVVDLQGFEIRVVEARPTHVQRVFVTRESNTAVQAAYADAGETKS